jgi:uncharacterized repeat protein (TIGR02543 family)
MCSPSLGELYISDLKSWCELQYAEYTIPLLYGSSTLYLGGEEIAGELIIPEGTTSIAQYAFHNCDQITSVKIPESVTYIGKDAFSFCSKLSKIELFGSANIYDCAFGWTSSNEDGQIIFYAPQTSIENSKKAIGDRLTVVCHPDDEVVIDYAKLFNRNIEFLPCDECNYIEVIDEKYLKTSGSCTEKSVYWYSCEVCKNPSDTLTFEGGYEHTFGKYPIADFLKKEADCIDSAVYYLSCSCGERSTETFSYGEALGHCYDDVCDTSCNRCSEVREAPHDIETEWSYDEDAHWNRCQVCGEGFNFEEHEYADERSEGCLKCEYYRTIFTLTYDADGGTDVPETAYVQEGAFVTITEQKPTKVGCVFIGWMTEENGEAVYFGGESITLDGSMTLYARWKTECHECEGLGEKYITSYRCSYCRNGYRYSASCTFCFGDGKMFEEDVPCGICAGYGYVEDPLIGGLKNCSGCKGSGYVASWDDCTFCRTVCNECNGSSEIKIWASCDNCDGNGCYDEYNVYFNANGGSFSVTSQRLGGNNATIGRRVPTKDGYVFVGWNTFSDNNAVYLPGDVYNAGEDTLYAMWMPLCQNCSDGNAESCNKCNGKGYISNGWHKVLNELTYQFEDVEYTDTCSKCNGKGYLDKKEIWE